MDEYDNRNERYPFMQNRIKVLDFHNILKIKRDGGKTRLLAFYNKHISKVH